MARQETLALWGSGIVKTRAGHLRYTSPKELRGKYVHRKVVEDRLEETPYSIRLLLPWPYEVHHLDWNKENNQSENLLLLDMRLHSIMTSDGRPRDRGQFVPRWKVIGDRQYDLIYGEEVPF